MAKIETIFMLINDRQIRDFLSDILYREHYIVTDDFKNLFLSNHLILDFFYYESGVMNLIPEVRPDLPLILIGYEYEIRQIKDRERLRKKDQIMTLPSVPSAYHQLDQTLLSYLQDRRELAA